MKIEELFKDLDPVTIIEFKNYVIEILGNFWKKNRNSKFLYIDNYKYTRYNTYYKWINKRG